MNDTAEIIKALLTSWPVAMIVIVLILRAPFRAVVERTKKFTIGHGDTKAEIEIVIYVLESQELMIGVYALGTVFQKVDKTPNADVSAKDAQVFVRSCMTILSRLLYSLSLEGER